MTPASSMNWDDLKILLSVAQHGSFTRAAAELGIRQTTVSRRVAELERCLGSKLLHRHGRGAQLTRCGAELARRALSMDSTVHEIERFLAGRDQAMSGMVRITATDGLINFWLMPQIKDFQKDHPLIRLEIFSLLSWESSSTGDADIAIRHAQPVAKRVPAQKVGRTRFALYASQSYLKDAGVPRTLDELLSHRVVENLTFQFNPALVEWTAFLRRHHSVLAASSAVACLSAVRCGAGIGLFPAFYKSIAPELVALNIPLRPIDDVWLVSNPDTSQSARVQAVLRFLTDRFAQDRAAWFS